MILEHLKINVKIEKKQRSYKYRLQHGASKNILSISYFFFLFYCAKYVRLIFMRIISILKIFNDIAFLCKKTYMHSSYKEISHCIRLYQNVTKKPYRSIKKTRINLHIFLTPPPIRKISSIRL